MILESTPLDQEEKVIMEKDCCLTRNNYRKNKIPTLTTLNLKENMIQVSTTPIVKLRKFYFFIKKGKIVTSCYSIG